MKVRLLLISVLLPVAIASLTGCPQRNYTLPANWPIPQLTLPPGSELSSAPSVMLNLHLNDTPLDRNVYSARFNAAGSWTSVAGHVEQCLAPLKYVEYVIVYSDGSTSEDQLHSYWSPDEKTEIELLPLKQQATPEFILRITEYSQSQDVLNSDRRTTSKGVRTEIRPL